MNFEYLYPTNDKLTPEQRLSLAKYLQGLIWLQTKIVRNRLFLIKDWNHHHRQYPIHEPFYVFDIDLENEIQRIIDLLSNRTHIKYEPLP